MSIHTQEARIILAIEAIRTTKKITIRKAAKIYKVLRTTLTARIASWTERSEYRQKAYKLTKLKEKVIIQHIIDLDLREFAS